MNKKYREDKELQELIKNAKKKLAKIKGDEINDKGKRNRRD